ncbi:MAG TPA: HDOD domain-containing protein [Burkholderiaceae bacterium]
MPTNSGVSKSAVSTSAPNSDQSSTVRDRLLEKIINDATLPALGSSVTRVVQMASSDDEAVRDLAHFVLSDVALTQKILRVSNTVSYRTTSSSPVTTISKAIFLLGFDTVKTVALAILLVDGMSGKRAKNVRAELAHAMCASVVGCELAKNSQFRDAEEAAIAALFKNMGRLLLASHDHELYSEMSALIQDGKTSMQASQQVLGCSLESLAESVLKEWEIPESIVQALAPLPSGVLKPAKNKQEWMQQVAAFSTAAATLIPKMNQQGDDAASKALLARFGGAFNLDQEKLGKLFSTVAHETSALLSNANLPPLLVDRIEPEPVAQVQAQKPMPSVDFVIDPIPEEKEQKQKGLPAELLFTATDTVDTLEITARHSSGKPVNARDLLLAGVRDVTEMMSSGRCKANDLIMLVLETLYHSMGFRFATVCLKDMKTNQFRARISLGDNNAARQAGFVFSTGNERDLFHLAVENDADLLISNATDPKIRNLIPAWHRALLPDAKSFIVLPLIVQKKAVGLFYADRTEFATEGVPADETALIKTLKGQVLGALNAR